MVWFREAASYSVINYDYQATPPPYYLDWAPYTVLLVIFYLLLCLVTGINSWYNIEYIV